jgi:uncharacterized membrane protein YcaP (DUF421 family)
MFVPDVHWAELIARGALTYVFLLIILRLTGKRQVGQLAPFDLVLLLVLSNGVQNAMNGGDNSYTGGVIIATTLIVLNLGVGLATAKSKWLEKVLEGRPRILIHNGKILEDVMAREQITHHELMSALRVSGVANVREVRFAVLENNGQISVVQRSPHSHDHSDHADALPKH